jgi:transposase-like protein
MEAQEVQKTRRQSKQYNASQKAQAVLSVWTERRKPHEICRELGIGWTILDQWQKRAMEGMLQALEPNVNLENGSALSPRLQTLLTRKRQSKVVEKIERRLNRKIESEEK